MNARLLLVPSLCVAGAAALLLPARPAQGFSKIGGSLGESQRDFRIFNNFLDATANNNANLDAQFPGRVGAALAVWKGAVEWGSLPHGDGTGDPIGGNVLGGAGANFDPMWAGNTNGIGTSNNNIVSSLDNCGGGGTLAFTETPIGDGWRIRFCDEWTWDDGPGTINFRWDIQGVMTHEYGHALGLGHSGNNSATMAPAGSAGSTIERSIETDDINGIRCIYGVASGTKPVITATVADMGAGTITIHGSNFAATGNEVWFTNAATTGTGGNPIVSVGSVASSNGGTQISLSIPAGAGKGDVMVNTPGAGNSTLSNAFPTDLEGTFGVPPGPSPMLTNVSPASVEALIPGTAETITLTGTDLDLTTAVLLDGDAVPVSSWTIVNPTTITLDMPQASSLGAHDLGVTDGFQTSELAVSVVAPAEPKLQWGNGDPANAVSRAAGLDLIVAGTPGEVHVVRGGPVAASLSPMDLRLGLVPWSPLIEAGTYVIPARGWQDAHLGAIDPALVGMTWFARSYALVRPRPFPESNLQSITLVP